ncbi:MAG: bacteriohemerythrin [Treponema sp.]|nr:bacteriohemerythrin [Treponema sp.]
MKDDSVTWDNIYSVGFEPIDNQHKELVKIINELFDLCKKGDAVEDSAVLKMIDKATDYAGVHFADEMNFMRKAGYPKIKEHRQLHDDFIETLLKSIQEYKAGKAVPIELARFLKNWLFTHIAEQDKQYSPYVAKL